MVAARRHRLTLRGVARILGLVLLGLLLAVLLVLLSFLAAPTRGVWLRGAIDRAQESLPGQLSGEWTWPALDRLEGRDLVWTIPRPGADPDTLAVIRRLALELDLAAARDHELRLRIIELDAALVDAARMAGLFVTAAPDSQTADGPPPTIPWFRAGSLPGAPSLAIDRFVLGADRLVLPDEVRIRNLGLAGSAAAPAGGLPVLSVDLDPGRTAGAAGPLWRCDLSRLTLMASYDPAAAAARVDTLSAALPTLSVRADSLLVAAGPVELNLSGGWGPSGGRARGSARFAGEVPGPLREPLPGLAVQELAGVLGFELSADADSLRASLDLDLDPRGDLRRGALRGSLDLVRDGVWRPAAVALEGLDLDWLGTKVSAAGDWSPGTISGRLAADLPDLRLPSLLAPAFPPGLTGRVRLRAKFSGPPDDPVVEAELSAAGSLPSLWDLPGSDRLAAQLPPDFPRNEFRRLVLTGLRTRASGTIADLQVGLRLDVSGTPWLDRGLVSAATSLDLRGRTIGVVELDTALVALRGAEAFVTGSLDTAAADLQAVIRLEDARLPALLAPEAAAGLDLALVAAARVQGGWQDLRLQAEASGRAAHPEAAAGELHLLLDGSARGADIRLSAGRGVRLGSAALDSLTVRWEPEVLQAGADPAGDFRLEAWAPRIRARAEGSVGLGEIQRIELSGMSALIAGERIELLEPARVTLGPGPRDAAVSSIRLGGDQGTLSLAGRSLDGESNLVANTDLFLTREWLQALFPSPFWAAGGGVDLDLSGHLEAAVSPGLEPEFSGRAEAGLIPRNEEPPAVLTTAFRTAAGDTAGLQADLDLRIGQEKLLSGSFLWPGRIDPATGTWRPAEGGAGRLDIPRQDLPLDFINRFLPPEVSLAGRITAGAGVSIAQADTTAPDLAQGAVSGDVVTKGLQVGLPNRSRVGLDAALEVGGKLIDPGLTGTITVTDGLFRLPEAQRALHPALGTAVLWDAAAADSSGAAAGWGSDRDDGPAPVMYLPDLDLTVDMPGNVRVTGYGLECELAGDFTVRRGWDDAGRPAAALRGRIRIVDGTLRALSRVFEFERGEIDLEGRVPVDPALNLVMVTDIDGTTVRIRVTGTALQPKIELESEPAMGQADIMAFILFGRPVNELDTDQSNSLGREQSPVQQLRQNLQGLALVFGAAGLQNTVSGKIGVDQVQIGSDAAGGSTLMLGKFLNPRVLLKYHQSLERSGTYFMTLEYALNRLFKLISTYGQGEEASGLELRWQRRY